MNKRHVEESNNTFKLDSNIQRPKAVTNQKSDRHGSKTAPIDSYFVNFF